MTTDNTHSSALESYLAQLQMQLASRGVPPQEAEQILAEVRAHVSETGEDPYTAFGLPAAYAAHYGSEATVPPPMPHVATTPSRAGLPAELKALVIALVVIFVVVPIGLVLLGLLFLGAGRTGEAPTPSPSISVAPTSSPVAPDVQTGSGDPQP